MTVQHKNSRWKQLAWFVALWCAGVITVALTAYIIKLVIPGGGS